ncbi:MAG: 2,4-dienoyl-CoA reductase [Rhodocyclaceae bacterium]|nr:NADPH-dependent 2,4-dienoyl-CoA reductase [Rhodocyclaceae bacterium]MCG3187537.1 2,4-dienoyl-CoA reductase [Rhodocyclaceae bacterium]
MSSNAYPHLVKPLDFGFITLRNRVFMGSMHTRLEDEPDGMARLAAFYAERARGEAGLIVTGGFSPNEEGLLGPAGRVFNRSDQIPEHRSMVDAVHQADGKLCMQILHAGRYAKHDRIVGPSNIRSPINPRIPRPLSSDEVTQVIEDYAQCAVLAREAGYDAVEIMGSEGYFLHQFFAPRSNQRTDEWGGSLANRMRLPVEVTKRVRARLGSDFLIVYRISILDLVEGGNSGEEIVALARELEAAGANMLNTGIGWHDAPVPTIAYAVPRAAWQFAIRPLRQAVEIPLVLSNRINTPEVAEAVIASGDADMVSMARPMLADAHFARKVREGRADEINTCIACNQACLDYIFRDQVCSCLVNPYACHETVLTQAPAPARKKIAIVGAGPAGLATAIAAAERGHAVTLFEAGDDIGGQFNLARRIPAKREFNETLRYYRTMLRKHGVALRLGVRTESSDLAGFDEIVIATGVSGRTPAIPGIDHPTVLSYTEALTGAKPVGRRVAIIGMGGIGYDMAEFLCTPPVAEGERIRVFLEHWGVDPENRGPGGFLPGGIPKLQPAREVTMLQRKSERPGGTLGLTTGWVLKSEIARYGVRQVVGVSYEKIDDQGLHYRIQDQHHVLPVDSIVICAGQESVRGLYDELVAAGRRAHLVGGASKAAELDALYAIREGTQLGLRL